MRNLHYQFFTQKAVFYCNTEVLFGFCKLFNFNFVETNGRIRIRQIVRIRKGSWFTTLLKINCIVAHSFL